MAKRKLKDRIPGWAAPALGLPVYAAIRMFLAGLVIGDLEANVARARSMGRLYAKFEKKRFQRTMQTLRAAFPSMGEDEAAAHALQAYEHLFTLAVETAYTPRLLTPDNWSKHVRLGNLHETLHVLVSGRPSVLITGHCGNWELLGTTLALLGYPMHALYRPLDLKPLDRWVRKTRQRRGLVLVDKFGAAQRMPQMMAEGARVGVIADQNAGDRGLFVPFFGRLASTYKSIGFMALQYDAPIVCGQARRLVMPRDASGDEGRWDEVGPSHTIGFADWTGEPFRYRVDVIDIIYPEQWKAQPDPLFYVTARYRKALEKMVEAAPEQNLWLHRYWKSRPRHERLGKPFPAELKEKLRSLPWMTEEEMGRIEEWSARDAATVAAGGRT
ncbi:MAG TPA: lysophospholipid acyltransferase family protein [Phycisphaerales bacterium]|nr:lysophospholipid acyltransferase family protein [Phycisphaerales bacterium]